MAFGALPTRTWGQNDTVIDRPLRTRVGVHRTTDLANVMPAGGDAKALALDISSLIGSYSAAKASLMAFGVPSAGPHWGGEKDTRTELAFIGRQIGLILRPRTCGPASVVITIAPQRVIDIDIDVHESVYVPVAMLVRRWHQNLSKNIADVNDAQWRRH